MASDVQPRKAAWGTLVTFAVIVTVASAVQFSHRLMPMLVMPLGNSSAVSEVQSKNTSSSKSLRSDGSMMLCNEVHLPKARL